MRRRVLVVLAAFALLVAGTTAASAHSGTFTLNAWPPVFNNNGNLSFKGQTKIVSCSTPSNCKVPEISVTVCAQIYLLGQWNTIGSCVSGSNFNNTQVTRSKVITCVQGGQVDNRRTKVTGYVIDHGVLWPSQAPKYSDPALKVCVTH